MPVSHLPLDQAPEAFELEPLGSSLDQAHKSRFVTFLDTFNRHPDSFDPNAELSLALDKSLKGYHSQLIALGGAIGTGLFVGSGLGLANTGPVPLLAAFCFVGLTLCPTIFALGEMATLMPLPGGFIEHCRTYTDEAWGGAMGWNYTFEWLLALPLELVSASITLQYWGNPLGHHSAWVAMFLAGIALVNVFGVQGYANVEAVLSIIKVIAIIGFLIFGILLDTGLGFEGNAIGVEYWYAPGAAHNGFYGFCSVLITAAFAYSGSEMVGLTAAEQENPKRDLPMAIKKVFWRIGLFFIASILLIGLLVPYSDKRLLTDNTYSSAASPFVIAIETAGVKVLPSVINTVILVTVLSVANSSIYGSSRVLNAMANSGLAPRIFAYIDTRGRPLRCLYLALAFGCLAFLSELKDEHAVFQWLLSTCGLSVIISWTTICFTHTRFRKALRLHERGLETLPYQSPLGVIGSWVGVILNSFIILCQFLTSLFPISYQSMSGHKRAQAFFISFMSVPITIIIFLAIKFFKGSKIHGIHFSKKTLLKFEDVRFERGGTKTRNLSAYAEEISFEGSWDEGDYAQHARRHPDLVMRYDALWFVPGIFRPFIRRLAFPWQWGGWQPHTPCDCHLCVSAPRV